MNLFSETEKSKLLERLRDYTIDWLLQTKLKIEVVEKFGLEGKIFKLR